MAKETKPAAAQGKEVAKTLKLDHAGDVLREMRDPLNRDSVELMTAIEDLGDEQFVALNGEYFYFDENKTYNILVTGVGAIANQYKSKETDPDEIPAVEFCMRNPENADEVRTYISAEAILRNKMQALEQGTENTPGVTWPLAFRVKTSGRKKGNNGEYLLMTISALFAAAPNA